MASPEIHARSTSTYFKFVAIYASIGGTFFGYAAFYSQPGKGLSDSSEADSTSQWCQMLLPCLNLAATL